MKFKPPRQREIFAFANMLLYLESYRRVSLKSASGSASESVSVRAASSSSSSSSHPTTQPSTHASLSASVASISRKTSLEKSRKEIPHELDSDQATSPIGSNFFKIRLAPTSINEHNRMITIPRRTYVLDNPITMSASTPMPPVHQFKKVVPILDLLHKAITDRSAERTWAAYGQLRSAYPDWRLITEHSRATDLALFEDMLHTLARCGHPPTNIPSNALQTVLLDHNISVDSNPFDTLIQIWVRRIINLQLIWAMIRNYHKQLLKQSKSASAPVLRLSDSSVNALFKATAKHGTLLDLNLVFEYLSSASQWSTALVENFMRRLKQGRNIEGMIQLYKYLLTENIHLSPSALNLFAVALSRNGDFTTLERVIQRARIHKQPVSIICANATLACAVRRGFLPLPLYQQLFSSETSLEPDAATVTILEQFLSVLQSKGLKSSQEYKSTLAVLRYNIPMTIPKDSFVTIANIHQTVANGQLADATAMLSRMFAWGTLPDPGLCGLVSRAAIRTDNEAVFQHILLLMDRHNIPWDHYFYGQLIMANLDVNNVSGAVSLFFSRLAPSTAYPSPRSLDPKLLGRFLWTIFSQKLGRKIVKQFLEEASCRIRIRDSPWLLPVLIRIAAGEFKVEWCRENPAAKITFSRSKPLTNLDDVACSTLESILNLNTASRPPPTDPYVVSSSIATIVNSLNLSNANNAFSHSNVLQYYQDHVSLAAFPPHICPPALSLFEAVATSGDLDSLRSLRDPVLASLTHEWHILRAWTAWTRLSSSRGSLAEFIDGLVAVLKIRFKWTTEEAQTWIDHGVLPSAMAPRSDPAITVSERYNYEDKCLARVLGCLLKVRVKMGDVEGVQRVLLRCDIGPAEVSPGILHMMRGHSKEMNAVAQEYLRLKGPIILE